MTKFVIAFDVEGPIVNPSFDFAWLVLENLVKVKDLRTLSEKVKIFDDYDDNRWLRERGMEGHSTGTTPVISSLLAVAYGTTNKDFLNLARQHLKLAPGASRLIEWIRNEKRIEPYFISSAHPAAILPVAYKLGIPSSHVFCSGYQLSRKRTESYDAQRVGKPENTDETLQKEIEERFPYEEYLNSESLQNFLNRYLELCGEMNRSYASGRTDEDAVRSSREKQLRLLEEARKEVSNLADDLRYLLYSEDGIMGAHRKKRALMSLEKLEKTKKEYLIYTGDSIVDADPIAYAGHGISVNCTNRQALISSKINVATPTMESLVPILELITSGVQLTIELRDTLQQRINEEISKMMQPAPPARIFLVGGIEDKVDSVIQLNRISKDYVRKLYSQEKTL